MMVRGRGIPGPGVGRSPSELRCGGGTAVVVCVGHAAAGLEFDQHEPAPGPTHGMTVSKQHCAATGNQVRERGFPPQKAHVSFFVSFSLNCLVV